MSCIHSGSSPIFFSNQATKRPLPLFRLYFASHIDGLAGKQPLVAAGRDPLGCCWLVNACGAGQSTFCPVISSPSLPYVGARDNDMMNSEKPQVICQSPIGSFVPFQRLSIEEAHPSMQVLAPSRSLRTRLRVRHKAPLGAGRNLVKPVSKASSNTMEILSIVASFAYRMPGTAAQIRGLGTRSCSPKHLSTSLSTLLFRVRGACDAGVGDVDRFQSSQLM
ncbi:hypothetical protein B0J13DRAFT_641326 [Dactylonectria estremocensis]|uniref:Uncharacterized protein n=1 Tax=Dactylonectria estremocensis TaxID=1079267 RepID=A0A9P9IWB2_9HYPO|nr:hypothetical protein B0J13DRAFT_641326 [Dactylonectria estremocensis]